MDLIAPSFGFLFWFKLYLSTICLGYTFDIPVLSLHRARSLKNHKLLGVCVFARAYTDGDTIINCGDQNRALECLTPVGDVLMTREIKCNLRVTSFHIIKGARRSTLIHTESVCPVKKQIAHKAS